MLSEEMTKTDHILHNVCFLVDDINYFMIELVLDCFYLSYLENNLFLFLIFQQRDIPV